MCVSLKIGENFWFLFWVSAYFSGASWYFSDLRLPNTQSCRHLRSRSRGEPVIFGGKWVVLPGSWSVCPLFVIFFFRRVFLYLRLPAQNHLRWKVVGRDMIFGGGKLIQVPSQRNQFNISASCINWFSFNFGFWTFPQSSDPLIGKGYIKPSIPSPLEILVVSCIENHNLSEEILKHLGIQNYKTL